MRNYKLILSLALVLMVSLLVSGCGLFGDKKNDDVVAAKIEFSGVVLDANDQPLKGIQVTLVGSGTSVTTDTEGEFTFADVQEGTTLVTLGGDQGIGQVKTNIVKDMEDVTYHYPVVTEVAILHMNDIHAEIENFAKLAAYADQLRGKYENLYLLSAGDMFSGNPIVDEYDPQGQPIIELMGAVGFNAMTLGNHDFDYGQDVLKDRMAEAKFPMISANLEVTTGTLTQPEPYVILNTANDLKVALLGLTTVSSSTGIPATHPDNVQGIEFSDPLTVALNYKNLADESNLFIALSHMGDYKDNQLAGEMGELDLIVGGHSHTLMSPAQEVNGVTIVQAGSELNYIGQVVVTLVNGQVDTINSDMIDVTTLEAEDANIRQKIDAYKEGVNLSEVIATAASPIDGKVELGNMITDAMVAQHGLDLAFTNNGGIRLSSLEGDITLMDVFEMLPFRNDIVKYEMTPDEIRSLITYPFNRWGGIDLEVSGITYTINVAGDAIQSIDLLDPQGNPLDENATYTVGLNSYVASSYEFTHTDPGVALNTTMANTVVAWMRAQNAELNYDGIERAFLDSQTIVATTEVELTGGKRYDKSYTAGNLITDAMRDYTGADIALFPSSNMQYDLTIAVGNVTDIALQSLYKYITGTEVSVATMTGADLKAFLLQQCDGYDNADVQVSGMQYTVTAGTAGITVDCYEADGITTIDDATVYTVAMDGYAYHNKYTFGASQTFVEDTTLTEWDILLDYTTNLGTIPASLGDPRIIVQ